MNTAGRQYRQNFMLIQILKKQEENSDLGRGKDMAQINKSGNG